jgi:hypothetical protein
VSVLFNREVNATQSGDGAVRTMPTPSPGTPRHPSYPSGHSTYSGAASEILSFFFPDYTAEFDKMADNTGMARLWAGIHWRSDHIQGMKLGRCVAREIITTLQDGCICPPDVCSTPDPCGPPPTYEELVTCSGLFSQCCQSEMLAEQPAKERGQARKELRGGGGGRSSAAQRAQAQGPQKGASPAGSPGDEEKQARGPQKGARTAGSQEADEEQAKGPQEGAK